MRSGQINAEISTELKMRLALRQQRLLANWLPLGNRQFLIKICKFLAAKIEHKIWSVSKGNDYRNVTQIPIEQCTNYEKSRDEQWKPTHLGCPFAICHLNWYPIIQNPSTSPFGSFSFDWHSRFLERINAMAKQTAPLPQNLLLFSIQPTRVSPLLPANDSGKTKKGEAAIKTRLWRGYKGEI